MEPEKEDGNIEYKLKLLDLTPNRIERITTQMRYRCNEGGSECIYVLGVEDDGHMTGMNEEEYNKTIYCIQSAAQKNSYSIDQLSKTEVAENKHIYEILIREKNENEYITESIVSKWIWPCGVNYSGKD